MFKPDPDKNWGICLVVCAFGLVFIFTFSHFLVIAIVLYAIVKRLKAGHSGKLVNHFGPPYGFEDPDQLGLIKTRLYPSPLSFLHVWEMFSVNAPYGRIKA